MLVGAPLDGGFEVAAGMVKLFDSSRERFGIQAGPLAESNAHSCSVRGEVELKMVEANTGDAIEFQLK